MKIERDEQGRFKSQGPGSFDSESGSEIAKEAHRKRVLEKYDIEEE